MPLEQFPRSAFSRISASPVPRIAVIGCGPSGLAVTIALMKGLERPFEAWMIDAADAPGAFAGGSSGDLPTNDAAGDLSVLAERPDDFINWLDAGILADGTVSALFGARSLRVAHSIFHTYLMTRFGEALAARSDVRLRTSCNEVRAVEAACPGFDVVFADGETEPFDLVFLATGFGLKQARLSADEAHCRGDVAYSTVAGLLSLDAGDLRVDDCGDVFANGRKLEGIAVIGAAVSGPLRFTDAVRQAHHAVGDVGSAFAPAAHMSNGGASVADGR